MLYNKKLDGIDALLLERKLLKLKLQEQKTAKAKQTKKPPKKSKDDFLEENILSFVQPWLRAYNGTLPLVAQAVLPLVIKKATDLGLRKVMLKTAKDIGAGYLKWKAIEVLGKMILKKIKQKKEA